MMTDSLSCSALDQLDLEMSTKSMRRSRSPSPSLRKGFQQPYGVPSLTSRWLRWRFCCRCSGRSMQKVLLWATIITTVVTWSGYMGIFNFRKAAIGASLQVDHAARSYLNARDESGKCLERNHTLDTGHINNCWNTDSDQLVCAPKVVFAGIEGCYNIDILSPLEFKTGLLMVNDSIHFGQHCSMEYLTKHYSQIRKELLNAPEPLFFVNDERLLTSLLPSTENQHRLGNELDKLKDWMEPSSKLVTFICDPVSRLILYVQKMLVLMEPTKEAVHKFVTRRLNKAKTCLSRHGAEECQQLDKKDDILYSFILQGIYYPYMVKLPKHISSDLIKAVYIDQTNASSYDVTMKRLAETLSVSIHDGRKNKCKEHQIEEAKNFNTLLTNMHPVTLAAIRKFYKPFQNDVNMLLRMYN